MLSDSFFTCKSVQTAQTFVFTINQGTDPGFEPAINISADNYFGECA